MPSLRNLWGLMQVPLARMLCRAIKASPTARKEFGG
jgi:hypothetical protein